MGSMGLIGEMRARDDDRFQVHPGKVTYKPFKNVAALFERFGVEPLEFTRAELLAAKIDIREEVAYGRLLPLTTSAPEKPPISTEAAAAEVFRLLAISPSPIIELRRYFADAKHPIRRRTLRYEAAKPDRIAALGRWTLDDVPDALAAIEKEPSGEVGRYLAAGIGLCARVKGSKKRLDAATAEQLIGLAGKRISHHLACEVLRGGGPRTQAVFNYLLRASINVQCRFENAQDDAARAFKTLFFARRKDGEL